MSKPAILGGEPELKHRMGETWPLYDAAEKEALMGVLESGSWYNGDRVRELEERFADYQDAKFAVATTAGTVALEVMCRATGVGAGDEVITSPYTFIGTCTAILKAGAVPVFVDMDPDTNNLDISQIEAAITPRTKAIMPVHYGGLACDMEWINTIAKHHGLVVLEDACHSWGAKYKDKGLGAWGTAGGFSFQQSKNMTSGDGGIVLTDDIAVADAVACAINQGRTRWDAAPPELRWGGNNRMTEFHAALLLAQLDRLPEHVEIREQNAAMLTRTLSRIDGIEPCTRLAEATVVSWHVYGARYDADAFDGLSREDFRKAMIAEGVGVELGYPEPVYRHAVFQQDWKQATHRPFSWIDSEHAPDYRSLNLPKVERYCKERIGIRQAQMLATEGDMKAACDAFVKVKEHAAEIRDALKAA